MITVTYKLHDNHRAKIEGCIDFGVTFEGKSLNYMPEANEVWLQFDVKGGAEDTLQDLYEVMGRKRFKKPIEFELKNLQVDINDEFKFKGTPIFYRMPDTSTPIVEIVLKVRYD